MAIIKLLFGLVAVAIAAMILAYAIAGIAFVSAVKLYSMQFDKLPNTDSILEVKEPHGYEHFRVEHQRDLLEVSNE